MSDMNIEDYYKSEIIEMVKKIDNQRFLQAIFKIMRAHIQKGEKNE